MIIGVRASSQVLSIGFFPQMRSGHPIYKPPPKGGSVFFFMKKEGSIFKSFKLTFFFFP